MNVGFRSCLDAREVKRGRGVASPADGDEGARGEWGRRERVVMGRRGCAGGQVGTEVDDGAFEKTF